MILQDELFDEHELGGHGGANKQPVLLREDLTNGAAGRGNIIAISITALFLSSVSRKNPEKLHQKYSKIFLKPNFRSFLTFYYTDSRDVQNYIVNFKH